MNKSNTKKCGLCGKKKKLTKTSCCNNWICDDHDKYVAFSYARNSCSRNHQRFTLCGTHYDEGHKEKWQDCKKCKKEIIPEMYVYFGTNEYNFEKLKNPPKYKPTKCSRCSKTIKLGTEGYGILSGEYTCEKCCYKDA